MKKIVATALAIALIGGAALAGEAKVTKLPAPQLDGGATLMQALQNRQTTRAFDAKELSPQTLSNLLWAAFGINRPESGKRTAPSALNWQEIDIYLARTDGLYLYKPKAHAIELVVKKDLRKATGMQPFVETAPLNLIYVADTTRITRVTDPAQQDVLMAADTGFIAQNVYLLCAAEKLGTVIRGMVDKAALAKAMGLKPTQKITLCQSVGYPAKK